MKKAFVPVTLGALLLGIAGCAQSPAATVPTAAQSGSPLGDAVIRDSQIPQREDYSATDQQAEASAATVIATVGENGSWQHIMAPASPIRITTPTSKPNCWATPISALCTPLPRRILPTPCWKPITPNTKSS